jgi:hypothetical protein
MTPSTTSTKDVRKFAGKRVLVTGGTEGAGKAIADRFLRGGATVAITARSAPVEGRRLILFRRTSRPQRCVEGCPRDSAPLDQKRRTMSSKHSVLISRLVNAELLSELLLSESEGAAYSLRAPRSLLAR